MNTTEVIRNSIVIQDEDRKLKLREKVACVIGGMTGTFHFQMIQMYLLYFYTDVMKINAAYVAGLFLFARVIDAFLAPAFGILVDKITTPWGKYKPWFVILTVPTMIFGWLTFTNVNLSPNGKLIYATVTYLIYSVGGALGQGPGAAMTPAITKRVDERVSIGIWSYVLVMVGAMVVVIGAQPLYKGLGGGNEAKGFSLLMGSAAVIGILISIFQVVTLKERYVVQTSKDEKKPSFVEMFKAVFTNKTAVIVYLFVFANNLANGIRSAVMIHYFKYYFHNDGLMVTMGIVGLVPILIGVMFSSKVTKLIGIKNNVLVSAILNIASMVSIIFVPANSTGVVIFLGVSVIASLFNGFSSPAQSAMMPAAMDYTEWKSGMNVNAFMGSIQGFMQTFATALSGAIAAGALAFVGYVPGVEQSSGTIFGLKVLMSILPAIIISLTLSVAWFDLTEDKQAQITKELAERRKNAEANTTD
ncbi:MAG: H+-glucitol symporter [Clostridiales bacterium]|nr:H+-glucitol symporter [Clostridiales bacterium]